ncbi:TolC family protein [Dysgonomonas macrotermitis]|uniref:Outer membrane protein, cobalt-zinc-cadmium efflux system n=1 Tax=Dysgonomonas macrotermitis TaxID=1346286 RepID=A0A1M5F4E9_9BACT|nr:TolC family protein [Dysgonomonas macrotermitis]SHF86409.1 outer membrane protein, cobalt-zinc-cadmium efflux system [Dysgonomonas macrotermitis]
MKKCLFYVLFSLTLLSGYAQENQTLDLNLKQIESLFLANNLDLIATKYNISIADAAISQARLWDNPSLSISNVNLWSTKSQRDEIRDMTTSSFAKNTEFSVELGQLIQTANKRGKLIQREKVSKEIAIQEFEEVLRGLKTELRKTVFEIEYSQSYLRILNNQQKSLGQLVEAYKRQVQQGNIAKNELLRLQSSLLELENEINETQSELNDQSKTLKILLNIPPLVNIQIIDSLEAVKTPETILLSDLLEKAEEQRPDMKGMRLQTKLHQKSLDYEKSLRVPDLTISAAYDRYGGVWKDFIGVGISIDLPFFNRNQGNIKAARLNIEQSQYLVEQHQNTIRHEIAAAYNNYSYAYDFYKRINKDSLLPELDSMLEAYTKNLLNRNISMLEYIDFMDAYRTNKQTMLNAQKKVDIQFEELQYITGTDIN